MYTLFHQHKITFDLHVNNILALGNQTAYQNTYVYIELCPGKIGPTIYCSLQVFDSYHNETNIYQISFSKILMHIDYDFIFELQFTPSFMY